ncbi:nucleolar protein 10-like [Branchiostoma lanceolatum]|uniref:nucleolar protein 10-like n=1 Tax=Branchiostoma lanceolatum TaxID=7740 RepID=UPI0034523BCD
MQVSTPNNVKIYNLIAGKTLPEWLTDRKKRDLQKKDADIQRRIQLIQDFEMPAVSNCIRSSRDGQYLMVTGTYKPRVRCYEVAQMSMKFERGLDAEVVTFDILSEDYSKVVFLHCDRYVEFHAQYGRYYRTRIPKVGRDFSFHYPSCDLYFVGASREVYRLNLEQGRFLNPLVTNSVESNVCDINPVHHLFACGTVEGRIECWDPRVRSRVGELDCALSSITEDTMVDGLPAISALKFKDGLTMAVGTSTGQILLYDIRSNRPVLVKDHHYGLPINSIEFNDPQDLVLSTDSKILKIWNKHTGKAYTSIEPESEINQLHVWPDSGLIFMANEEPKVLTYFVPSLGPAPRWCSFMDNLTEELEEMETPTVYDDYKFVTDTDLENLGLAHLIGSPLLRAYMHGYFMDIRLYQKAKTIAEPFAYEEYRRNKIRQKIEETRDSRVKTNKLPKVNRDLAQRLIEEEDDKGEGKKKKKAKEASSLLQDDRFSALFSNPEFQVDTETEEFRLLNPVVRQQKKKKREKREKLEDQFQEVEEDEEEQEEVEGRGSDDDSSSSEDDRDLVEELRKQHRDIRRERALQHKAERERDAATNLTPKFYELKMGEEFMKDGEGRKDSKRKMKASLGERVQLQEETDKMLRLSGQAVGSKELTFNLRKVEKPRETQRKLDEAQHRLERKEVRRSAGQYLKKPRTKPGTFWKGKKKK